MLDRCVCCGAIIPEGRQVCPNCEAMAEYKMADLCWVGVRGFRAIGTGKFFRAGNGRMKEEMTGVEYVNTVGAGQMNLDDWYLAMESAIHREGKTAVLAAKIEHAKTCAWLHTPKDILHYALELVETEVRNGKMQGLRRRNCVDHELGQREMDPL